MSQDDIPIDFDHSRLDKIHELALTRKARVQVTFAAKAAMERAKPNVGDSSIYNIYWDKWYSETRDRNQFSSDNAALTRCDPERDVGRTQAEEVTRDPFFCIYFARGYCGKGSACSYLHRIPTKEDEKNFENTRDCFGRERHRLDRDDNSGVGSFERDNRTLYVARIGAYRNKLYEVVKRHFEVWGEIEYLRCLYKKGIAFVRYKSRLSAEFAKEAMNNQSLDNNETLLVRWATDNPESHGSAAEQARAQNILVNKILEDPNKIHSLAFLHDTMEEGQLNEYYQQDSSGYADFLKQERWASIQAKRDIKENDEPEVKKPNGKVINAYTAAPMIHYSKEAGVVPPPPPPRKKRTMDEAPAEQKPSKKPSGLAAIAQYGGSDSE